MTTGTLSCKNDSCDNVICTNGQCVNGACDCFPGYEGPDCSVLSVTKFVGSWAATDDCGLSTHQYTATIAASSSALNILIITNLGGLGSISTVYATIDSLNIFIESQDIGNGIIVEGSGALNSYHNQITLSYVAQVSPDSVLDCSATWNLQ